MMGELGLGQHTHTVDMQSKRERDENEISTSASIGIQVTRLSGGVRTMIGRQSKSEGAAQGRMGEMEERAVSSVRARPMDTLAKPCKA